MPESETKKPHRQQSHLGPEIAGCGIHEALSLQTWIPVAFALWANARRHYAVCVKEHPRFDEMDMQTMQKMPPPNS